MSDIFSRLTSIKMHEVTSWHGGDIYDDSYCFNVVKRRRYNRGHNQMIVQRMRL